MKVLLIDSDPIARNRLEREIAAEPTCKVVSVPYFADGWTALMEADQPFDTVLADPGTPDGPGFEWLRQIRTGPWDRPISVVLCVAPDAELMHCALAIGARHFIFKPYFPPAIAAKLAQLAQARAYFNFAPAGV